MGPGYAIEQLKRLCPNGEDLCLAAFGKFLKVRMRLNQLLENSLLLRRVLQFTKDTADGKGPNILTTAIDIFFPGVDKEAHGAVALKITVFLGLREGDQVYA